MSTPTVAAPEPQADGHRAVCYVDDYTGPARSSHDAAYTDAVMHVHHTPGGHHINVEAVA